MFEKFPYTNLHELNLDWIIKITQDFLEQYTSIQQIISDGETTLNEIIANGDESLHEIIANGDESLHEIITNGESSITELTATKIQELNAEKNRLEALLQAWYNTHSEDIAAQLADALADMTTHYNALVGDLNTLNNQIQAAIQQKGIDTLATIPSDYTSLSNTVVDLTSAVENNTIIKSIEKSESVITISDAANDRPFDLIKVSIKPVQTGNGYPSPSNVRPITGHTEANICVSPSGNVDDSDNVNYEIEFPVQAGEVFGGTLEIYADGTGKLTVKEVSVTFDGSVDETFIVDVAGNYARIRFTISDMESTGGVFKDIISNIGYSYNTAQLGRILAYNKYVYYWWTDDTTATLQQAKTWLSSNNMQVIYKLDTDIEYSLTAAQIKTILGTTSIWADTGNIDKIIYPVNMNLYTNRAVYSSVAEMKADSELVDGRFAKTMGYYSIGDNGDGEYFISKSEPSGHYEILNNGLYAKLIIGEFVNPKQLGATGDNEIHAGYLDYNVKFPEEYYESASNLPITNVLSSNVYAFDSNDSADTIAIQKAVWIAQAEQKSILIPEGRYVLTKSIVFDHYNEPSISGCDLNLTRIYHYYANDTSHDFSTVLDKIDRRCIFNYYNGTGRPKNITNMTIEGIYGYSGEVEFKLIDFYNMNGVYIDKVWFAAANYGLYFHGNCSDIHIYNITTEYLYKYHIYNDSGDVYIDGANFWQSHPSKKSGAIYANIPMIVRNSGFRHFRGKITAVDAITFENCNFQFHGEGGISCAKSLMLIGCKVILDTMTKCAIQAGDKSLFAETELQSNSGYAFINLNCEDGEEEGKNKYSRIVNCTFKNTYTGEAGDQYKALTAEYNSDYFGGETIGITIINNLFEKVNNGTQGISAFAEATYFANNYVNYTNPEL